MGLDLSDEGHEKNRREGPSEAGHRPQGHLSLYFVTFFDGNSLVWCLGFALGVFKNFVV